MYRSQIGLKVKIRQSGSVLEHIVYYLNKILLSKHFHKVEDEHGIPTYNGRMFSVPHFHFQFKSVNISTILNFKLRMRVYVWILDSWLSIGIYIS